MTKMLRHARRIKPRMEIALTGRRLTVLVASQVGLLAIAFGSGYFIANSRSPAAAVVTPRPFTFRDPLAALDEDGPRPAYTFHERLTSRRPEPPPQETRAAAPVPHRSVRRRRPRQPRRVERIRALEDKVREIVANGARGSAVRSRPAPKAAPAARPSTDDELRRAMEEARPPAAPPKTTRKRRRRSRRISRAARRRKKKQGKFTLQVKAYPEKDRAAELVEHYRQRGLDAYLAPFDLPGKGRWFRVRIGRFASRRAAENYRTKALGKTESDAFVALAR